MLDIVLGSEALGDQKKKTKKTKTTTTTPPPQKKNHKEKRKKHTHLAPHTRNLKQILNTKEQVIICWIRKAVIKEVQNAIQTYRGLTKSRSEEAFQEIMPSNITFKVKKSLAGQK